MKNHLFPRENQKKTIFLVSGRIVSQKMLFLFFLVFARKKDGFSRQNHLFPRKKLVFLSKTIFFPRKKLVFLSKTIFFLGKTKKTIFLVSGRLVSQKDLFFGFFGFPRKKLVFLPKAIFFLGKVGFSRQNHLFPKKSRYLISLQDQAFPSKECAFLLFLRALRLSAVNIRFQCHHYCDSSPLSVSTVSTIQ